MASAPSNHLQQPGLQVILNKPLPNLPVPFPSPLNVVTATSDGRHKYKAAGRPDIDGSLYELYNLGHVDANRSNTIYAVSLPQRTTTKPLDSGWLAWAHAWGGFFVVFNCWGLNFSFGVFQDYYARTLLPGTIPSKIAWIGSTQLFLIFVLGLPIGRALDAGYFRCFFNIGSALLVLAVFGTSFCSKYWQLLLVQGIITGMGMGMVFCSGLVVIMTYFKRNIGLAIAIGAAGSSVGGIIYTLVAQRALPKSGFAWTMRYMGFIALATMVIPNAVFRAQKSARSQITKPNWKFLQEPAYLAMVAGMFFAFWGLYIGFYYIIPYATQTLDLSLEAATNLLLAMLAANLPGRFVPAIISDRCLGPLNTLVPSAALASLLMFLWPGAQTQGALTLLACAYGFVAAGVQSLYAITVREFAGEPSPPRIGRSSRNMSSRGNELDDQNTHGTVQQQKEASTEKLGLKSGFVLTIIGVACLTGTPIGGALVERGLGRREQERFLYAQMFAGASLATAAVCFLVSRVSKIGWQADRA